MVELRNIREDIDKIDDQITELFLRRMNLCKDVAVIKAEKGLPVLNSKREQEILRRIKQNSGDLERYSSRLFKTLFELSRSYQDNLCSTPSGLRNIVKSSIENAYTAFPETGVIACPGAEGDYSQMAADRLFPRGDIVYFKSFEGVFGAVEDGMCQFGILPIENSSNGCIRAVYNLLCQKNVYIIRSERLCITNRLFVKPGVTFEDISEIYSNEQALVQCGNFLSGIGDKVKLILCSNMDLAARYAAESTDRGVAAISSAECADLYGLVPLNLDIQDSDKSYTRFICISKKPHIYPAANRIGLILMLENKPGVLYKTLAKFSSLDINLLRLESFPIIGNDFKSMFFFELEASVLEPEVITLLEGLEREYEGFIYLGTYFESE